MIQTVAALYTLIPSQNLLAHCSPVHPQGSEDWLGQHPQRPNWGEERFLTASKGYAMCQISKFWKVDFLPICNLPSFQDLSWNLSVKSYYRTYSSSGRVKAWCNSCPYCHTVWFLVSFSLRLVLLINLSFRLSMKGKEVRSRDRITALNNFFTSFLPRNGV